MRIINTIADMRSFRAEQNQVSIGFVPTMGALHEGHMALIKTAKENNQIVVVSIFVNPKQFGEKEDFSIYPRTLDQDITYLNKLGVDVLFEPSIHEFYPNGFSTNIEITGPAIGLESNSRPEFFKGVSIVIAKFLCSIYPHSAYFGEKDYQQLCVIAQLTRDLNLPVHIIACPTVRKTNGLALSSRNIYLTSEQHAQAPTLYNTLKDCARKISSGKIPEEILINAKSKLAHHNFIVEYLELRQTITLAEVDLTKPIKNNCRLLVAAKLGKTRLIDNVEVNPN